MNKLCLTVPVGGQRAESVQDRTEDLVAVKSPDLDLLQDGFLVSEARHWFHH